MKQRILLLVSTLIITLFFLIACSKRSGMEEQTSGPFIDLVKSFPPNPMEVDSLELDSLRRIQFQ